MTTFTRTWNASYEATPDNADSALEGAQRIRDLKIDIKERGQVDHYWAGDGDDGKHKKITFQSPLGAKPTLEADEAALYTKTVSAKSELFYEDEDGNEVQLTSGGALKESAAEIAGGGVNFVPFFQASAPAGWTKSTDHNDKTLRVVSGTGGGSGGTTGFSSVFGASKVTGSTILANSDIAHWHYVAQSSVGSTGTPALDTTHITMSNVQASNSWNYRLNPTATQPDVGKSGDVNSQADNTTRTGHTHTLSLDLKYIDVIICSRN
jgi:hypothetical protein